jgi:NAD(P)-dependent dehydrogenase (short-subunit alcohol dehydrogenase family)
LDRVFGTDKVTSLTPIWRIASAIAGLARPEHRPAVASQQSLQACSISSPLAVLLDVKDIPQVGPLHRGKNHRGGKAEEIAYTALFLASDESSCITGTDIVLDGGWFSAAPYLTNERSRHMLQPLDTKDKAKGLMESFLAHFR